MKKFLVLVLSLVALTLTGYASAPATVVPMGYKLVLDKGFTVEARNHGPLVIRQKSHLEKIDANEKALIIAKVAEMNEAVKGLVIHGK